ADATDAAAGAGVSGGSGGQPPDGQRRRPFAAPAAYPALSMLVVVTLAAYVPQLLLPRWQDLLAPDRPPIRSRAWWRLLSGAVVLVHQGWWHVGSNMAVLTIWGRDTERRLGGVGLIGIYVATALLSSEAAVIAHPNTVGVGASGAVFGVLGALIGSLLRHRD